MIIMQGDEYSIPIQIETESGVAQRTQFAAVEITIGNLTKSFLKDFDYDSELEAFMFPITQEESFAFRSAIQPAQVRVRTHTGEVIGISLGDINIAESLSKAVL